MNLKISSRVLFVALIAALIGCSASQNVSPKRDGGRYARVEVVDQVERASDVYRKLVDGVDGGIPEPLLVRADCIAVLPEVWKGAFIAGGRYGNGVVSCRDEERNWSSPAFISIISSSIGFQFGAEATDLVLVFVGKEAINTLLEGSVTLGGDVRVAAGPVGRSIEGKTDFTTTGIYSYARSKGLFAGFSLEGSVLRPDWDSNDAFYGKKVEARSILSGKVDGMPEEGRAFVDLLPSSKSES